MQSPDPTHMPEDALVINLLLITVAYVFPTIQDLAYFFAVLVSIGTILINWNAYTIKVKAIITKIKGFFKSKK